MHLILQQDTPDDYVISTGITTSIREFVRLCGAEIGLTITFRNEGIEEIGVITALDHAIFNNKVDTNQSEHILHMIEKETPIIKVSAKYFRPTEVDLLIGNNEKARTKLGWVPEYDLPALITDMMQSDLKLMQKELYLKEGGYKTYNYFE
jgi:GDPmannose 4,6-dehydratase